MSALVIRAYWARVWGARDGAYFLAIAIVAGFFSQALDAAWWQVFVNRYALMNEGDVAQLRQWGLKLDVALKAVAVWAGYLHLKALHESLDPDEQKNWLWIDMPWYPKRRACLSRLSRILKKKG